MAQVRCAHIFLIAEGDPDLHRAVIETAWVRIEVYAVSSYEAGEALAKKLVGEGIRLIELCGSWGFEGAARITKAVERRVPVGVIAHQQHNAGALAEVMRDSQNPYNR